MKPSIVWAVAIVSAIAVALACAVWIVANPLPSYYDEALYAIYAIIDVWASRSYGLVGTWLAMLHVDPNAPPGLRLLALPLTLLSSPSLTVLRAISLAGFFGATTLAATAVRRAAGPLAGAFAFLFSMTLPILVLSTRMFGTEYPLLLAVGLLLVAFTSRRAGWLIAVSVGLGLLAKTSYVVIALPMLMAAGVMLPERRRPIAIGTVAGFTISLLWWSSDPMRAIRFGIGSGNFIRHSLGHNPARYLFELVRCDFGVGIAAIVLLIAVVALRRRTAPPLALICVAGSLPLIVMHALSVNQNPRLVAIPTFLLALAAATLTPLLSRGVQSVAVAIAFLQVIVMTMPMQRAENGSYIWRGVTEVMAPLEQWDWSLLHHFALQHQLPQPSIAILGEGYAFNAPQIRYAWPELRGYVQVVPLYEWTAGKAFDLHESVERAARAQLVVTAVGYQGEASDGQVPNNRYNAQFAAALARDGRFEGPYELNVGRHHPAQVQVFVRRGS